MPSSGLTKNKARSVPAKVQGRKVLRALCNFMLPLIQGAERKTINMKKFYFGIEVDEFVTELEIFMSGMISCSRPHSQVIGLEATLDKDWLDYFQETNWLWEIAVPEDKTSIDMVSRGKANPRRIPMEKSMTQHDIVPQPMSSHSDDAVQELLQGLRQRITQKMPIRLLYFEPHNGKLKISLLNRAEVYDYLAPKLRADYSTGRYRKFGRILIKENAKYAILSHTWTQTPGELTYGDWQNGALDDKHPKCQKLINFCKAAWENHGLTLGWIDTVCINKESSTELDESIRSMYAWYSNANVCVTYLAGTTILSDIHHDPWFTRGWTLQELVAPRRIKFYNKDWIQLSSGKSSDSDKGDLSIREELSLATTMDEDELKGIQVAPISRRMQLAAKRQVTREEDIAYCLMGIFDVSISTAYGEGAERAFFRLVEEIFRSTKDVSDIFNWAGNHTHFSRQPITSLFPSHPSNYLNRTSEKQLRPWRLIEPLTLTHLGLRTPILLMPAVPICESVFDHQLIGDYHATVSVDPFKDSHTCEVPKDYHLLDKRFSGPEGLHQATVPYITFQKISTLTFGALNVEEWGTGIHVLKTCLAVLLQSTVELKHDGFVVGHSPGYDRIYTKEPIVFDLQKTGSNTDNKDEHYYKLDRSELAKHGMELVTLYL